MNADRGKDKKCCFLSAFIGVGGPFGPRLLSCLILDTSRNRFCGPRPEAALALDRFPLPAGRCPPPRPQSPTWFGLDWLRVSRSAPPVRYATPAVHACE